MNTILYLDERISNGEEWGKYGLNGFPKKQPVIQQFGPITLNWIYAGEEKKDTINIRIIKDNSLWVLKDCFNNQIRIGKDDETLIIVANLNNYKIHADHHIKKLCINGREYCNSDPLPEPDDDWEEHKAKPISISDAPKLFIFSGTRSVLTGLCKGLLDKKTESQMIEDIQATVK